MVSEAGDGRECARAARPGGRPLRAGRRRIRSQIRVARGTRTMDGKSILGLLLLAAARGSEIVISAEGPG